MDLLFSLAIGGAGVGIIVLNYRLSQLKDELKALEVRLAKVESDD
jgi:hypothetical protein